MAVVITGRRGSEVYPEVIDVVRHSGVRRDSRNGLTYDLRNVVLELESPLSALPLGCGRGLNPRIAAAEALQLVGEFSDPTWLCQIAPQFERFLDDTVDSTPGFSDMKTREFYGAYGHRVHRSSVCQLEEVARKLTNDPRTRQAVVTLWDPTLDNIPGKRDYPCTLALNFSRGGPLHDRLNVQVVMRSNDVWLGLPYDLFQFTQLQLTLCNVLDLLPGTYTHIALSMHLYLTNVEESYSVVSSADAQPTLMSHVTGVGHVGQSLTDIRERARQLAFTPSQVADPTPSERWYVDLLREFSLEK